jgi:hypothetical protein
MLDKISVSHGGEYEDDSILECDGGSKHLWNVGQLLLDTTWRNIPEGCHIHAMPLSKRILYNDLLTC